MKKINKRAMTKFSDTLAAWKVRVKHAIDKKEPYFEIVKDNPTIIEEQFEIFKADYDAEDAKEKSKYMKGLQERNMGCHHLGSRGYGGKRSCSDQTSNGLCCSLCKRNKDRLQI